MASTKAFEPTDSSKIPRYAEVASFVRAALAEIAKLPPEKGEIIAAKLDKQIAA